MKSETQIGIGVVLLAGVGYYFYDKNQKKQNLIQNAISTTEKNNNEVLSEKYNSQEVSAKALVSVKDWVKTYDVLSADVLNQKSKDYLFYEKIINDLKAKNNLSQSETFELTLVKDKLSKLKNSLLKDKIKEVKDIEYSKVYNILKELYAQYPKADVDKLMIILPNYLSATMIGQDYKYYFDVYDKLSIDDKLYLTDVDFYKNFEKNLEKQNPNLKQKLDTDIKNNLSSANKLKDEILANITRKGSYKTSGSRDAVQRDIDKQFITLKYLGFNLGLDNQLVKIN
jgi:hypothetical protein